MRIVAGVFLAILVVASAPQLSGAEIGSKIGSFQVQDLSGQTVSSQFYTGKILVLIFWSFKCPVSLVYNDRMEELRKEYGSKGVTLVAIASGSDQNAAEIRANATNLKLNVPVLLDVNDDLGAKLGATHAPSAFILDTTGVLRYKGALDNNKKPGENGRIAYINEALDSVLAGTPVQIPETKAFGCSIRRKGL
jgi:peroxiredoxin